MLCVLVPFEILPALISRLPCYSASTRSRAAPIAFEKNTLLQRSGEGSTATSSPNDLVLRRAEGNIKQDDKDDVLHSRTVGLNKIIGQWDILRSEVSRPGRKWEGVENAVWHEKHPALLSFKRLKEPIRYESLRTFSEELDKVARLGRLLNEDGEDEILRHSTNPEAEIAEDTYGKAKKEKEEKAARAHPYFRPNLPKPVERPPAVNRYYDWIPLYNAALGAHNKMEGATDVAGRVPLKPKPWVPETHRAQDPPGFTQPSSWSAPSGRNRDRMIDT